MKKFEDIVMRAMGYNEDREDQVSVSSIPFSEPISIEGETEGGVKGFDILKLVGNYRKIVINLLLVALVFFIIVRPLLKSIKKVSKETILERKELPAGSKKYAQISESGKMNLKGNVLELSKKSPRTAEQVIKGWLGESR